MDNKLFTWKTSSDTLDELQKGFKIAQESNAKSLMVLTCSDNNYPEDELNALLETCLLPIFGGIYPMVTYQEALLKHGALIVGFPEGYEATVVSDLHQVADDEFDLEDKINSQLANSINLNNTEDFIMFYDGLMTNIEDFIDCLFESLDHRISIVGGGAGNLDFIQRPCIFTNRGVESNVVLLVSLPKKLTANVAHGWKIFEGPFLVSEAQGQTVKSLNYKPAFNVYSQAIEKGGHYKFQPDNFFDIAKHFPLGIEDISSNLIVRDPILTTNNHLLCVGKVPINSMIYLLEGDIDTLISAAEDSAKKTFLPRNKLTDQVAMVFDCISRVLYMEDDFDRELKAINKHCQSSLLFGVLSIGEIANSPSGAIGLLNKSTVISTW